MYVYMYSVYKVDYRGAAAPKNKNLYADTSLSRRFKIKLQFFLFRIKMYIVNANSSKTSH